MRRQNRRLALAEEIDRIQFDVQPPARQGRRAAVMPTDQLLLSQRPSLASQTESTDGAETDGGDHSAPLNRRDMAADVEKFLATLQTNIDKSDGVEDDEHDVDAPDGVSFSTEEQNTFESLITRQRISVRRKYTEYDSDSSHYSD